MTPSDGDEDGQEVLRRTEPEVETRDVDGEQLVLRADEVDGLVAEPGQHLVEQPLALREHHALPDDADDGQREHDRDVVEALVDARAADALVEQVGEQDPERRRSEEQEHQQDDVVEDRREQLVVEDREDLPVVAEPDESDVADGAMPFQSLNDSRIVASAGNHTNVTWITVGMPTITQITILSRRVSCEKRRRRGSGVADGTGTGHRRPPVRS